MCRDVIVQCKRVHVDSTKMLVKALPNWQRVDEPPSVGWGDTCTRIFEQSGHNPEASLQFKLSA